jgi:hypothetical protein
VLEWISGRDTGEHCQGVLWIAQSARNVAGLIEGRHVDDDAWVDVLRGRFRSVDVCYGGCWWEWVQVR